MSATVEYFFLVAAFGVFGSAVYYTRVVRPRNIENGLRNAAGFHADIVHIGISSGIGFDFRSHQFAFCQGNTVKTFPAQDFYDWAPVINPVTDAQGKVTRNEHFIVILTNNFDTPKLSIDFGLDETKTLQCLISVRRWAEHVATHLHGEQQNTTGDTPTEGSEGSDPAAVAKLRTFLSENGYSREDALSAVRSQRRKSGVMLLWGNYESLTGKPLKWGFRTDIADALRLFFERLEGDHDNFGYTPGALPKLVNSDIRELIESEKQKELETLRLAAKQNGHETT